MRNTIAVALLALAGVLCASPALAQRYSVLLDTDRNAGTGCSVPTPAGTAAGIEWRLTAVVDGSPPRVVAVERTQCQGGAFGAAVGAAADYPVGLDNGIAGADVVELSTSLGLVPGDGGSASLYFLAESTAGADLVSGLGLSVPVEHTLPVAIPSLHWAGLSLIVFAVLLLARRSRSLQVMSVGLLLLGSGMVWAANFIADGQVADWSDRSPLRMDPANSSSSGEDHIEITSVWSAIEAGNVFFRIDIVDMEAAANSAPQFTSAPVVGAVAGSLYTYAIEASDPDVADVLVFSATTLPSWLALVDNGDRAAVLSGTPAAGDSGANSVVIAVADGFTATSQSFEIIVDTAPTITSAGAASFAVGVAGSFTFTATGSPAPGFALSACSPALPASLTLDASSGVLAGSPQSGDGGTYACTLTAANGVSPEAVAAFVLTINEAPSITSAASTSFTTGMPGSFTITAQGFPGGAAISLAVAGALPSGVTFIDNGDGTATLSGTPADGTGGTYALSLTASNGIGADASQAFTLQVGQGPVITSAGSATFTVGTAASFTITSTGVPTPALAVQGALPAGVGFIDNGDGTATLSGTAAAGSGGTYPLSLTASNGIGADGVQAFTLQVDQPPAITSAASASFTVGVAESFTVTATGVPAPALAVQGTLPAGVGFTDNGDGTGTLAGQALALSGGVYALTLTAANGVGTEASQAFTLTVLEAPTITSAAGHACEVGQPCSFAFAATGHPAAGFSLPGLPAGLTVDAGSLSGTPGAGTGGDYALALTASNGSGSDVQAFALTVGEPPTITSANSIDCVELLACEFTFAATGHPAPGFDLPGLPAGLTLDPVTGVLTGKPVAGTAAEHALVLAANNAFGSDAQAFTLTITPFTCPAGGAFVNGKCWYASTQCETTQAMCSSVGLPGTVGYTAVTWDAAALQAVADALGLVAGGLNGCCVEFAWVQNNTIFTHNYGSQYYNWDMCFNNLPTVKACDLP